MNQAFASRVVDAIAGRIDQGSLRLERPDGSVTEFSGSRPGPRGEITILDARVEEALVRHGASALGEGYVEGWWDTPDLAAFLTMAAINQDAAFSGRIGSAVKRSVSAAWNAVKPDRRSGAVDTMAGHYNLGNEFYELWLDPSMTYSSGIFTHTDDLESAQRAKYARIAELAGVSSGTEVLEIGCGWGGFAEHAGRLGAAVTGLTIAEEQLKYAEKRMAETGLSDRTTFKLVDFADERGRYDAVVSIEMIESIDHDRWPALFEAIAANLRQGGRAGLQAIVIDDGIWETYRTRNDFIREYIFPGGRVPPPRLIRELADSVGLRTVEIVDFGPSYAKTLSAWLERFDAAWPAIARLGFDGRFRRMWRYYLAYCEAGFNTGRISVQQWAFERGT
jgi:cyclopropane-fatty-acyl-phospholipid synthase